MQTVDSDPENMLLYICLESFSDFVYLFLFVLDLYTHISRPKVLCQLLQDQMIQDWFHEQLDETAKGNICWLAQYKKSISTCFIPQTTTGHFPA